MYLAITFAALLFAIWVFMTFWFVIAKMASRLDVVDSAWGLGFVYVAWLSWLLAGQDMSFKFLAAIMVTLWGLRLFAHISLRTAHKSEDRRYQLYRQKWGKEFWSKTYLNIFLLQATLILLISTTTVAIMTAPNKPLQILLIAGFIIWLLGIGFEALADWQLAQFVVTKKKGEVMQSGLWRYSRHPNYFGEITTWSGAALVAISVGQWWGIIGAAVITILIVKVSGVPPIEKHYASNPAFQKYAKKTSVLFPLPPKH